MAVGIYKPGHGYWTRVMTAVLVGVVVLAGAGWLWNQAALIPIPVRSWEIITPTQVTSPPAGASLTLQAAGTTAADQYRPIGSATLTAYTVSTRSQARLSVSGLETTELIGLDAIQAVQINGGPSIPVSGVSAIPAFDPVYLQGGIAAVVILLGAAVTYYFVALRRGTADFLIATDGEMKKVNWSTRKDVIGSTWVVIAASVVLAAGLFVVDILFSNFFRLIGVLDT